MTRVVLTLAERHSFLSLRDMLIVLNLQDEVIIDTVEEERDLSPKSGETKF